MGVLTLRVWEVTWKVAALIHWRGLRNLVPIFRNRFLFTSFYSRRRTGRWINLFSWQTSKFRVIMRLRIREALLHDSPEIFILSVIGNTARGHISLLIVGFNALIKLRWWVLIQYLGESYISYSILVVVVELMGELIRVFTKWRANDISFWIFRVGSSSIREFIHFISFLNVLLLVESTLGNIGKWSRTSRSVIVVILLLVRIGSLEHLIGLKWVLLYRLIFII